MLLDVSLQSILSHSSKLRTLFESGRLYSGFYIKYMEWNASRSLHLVQGVRRCIQTRPMQAVMCVCSLIEESSEACEDRFLRLSDPYEQAIERS